MDKRILVVYYSQSGQLGAIVDSFLKPFYQGGISTEIIRINPKNDFTFPWTSDSFFAAMPESVLGTPMELESFNPKHLKYDLVVFAYQPWFLNPSIPSISALKHPDFTSILGNTPVVTIIGARNMWLNAQERVKEHIKVAKGQLMGNIVFIDKNNNLVSAITILYWMLTGKKDKMWGVFPKPGVADEDIAQCEKFGKETLLTLIKDDWNGLQPKLVQLKAVEVKSSLMFIESRAGRLFSIWANIIKKRKNRSLWLKIFKYYLLIALFIIAPVVLIINNILFRPFLGKVINKKKQYYLGLN